MVRCVQCWKKIEKDSVGQWRTVLGNLCKWGDKLHVPEKAVRPTA